jgi:hypothetical protein
MGRKQLRHMPPVGNTLRENCVPRKGRVAKSAKQGRDTSDLEKTLALIRERPGIRPSEINRLLNREESDGLRSTLIKRGLIRKEKDGNAMRYFRFDVISDTSITS